MSAQSEKIAKKLYAVPRLKKLNFEQASLFLVGHAWNGDPEARDLLERMFPVANEETH